MFELFKPFVAVALALLLGTYFLAIESHEKEGVENPEQIKPIKGLTTVNREISSGTFILGIGSYTSGSKTKTNYYLYVFKKEGYVLREIDADKVEIVEQDDISPCIKGRFADNGNLYSFSSRDYDKYIVYVPTGTIFEEYKGKLP